MVMAGHDDKRKQSITLVGEVQKGVLNDGGLPLILQVTHRRLAVKQLIDDYLAGPQKLQDAVAGGRIVDGREVGAGGWVLGLVEEARGRGRSVIFLDEIEALAPCRASLLSDRAKENYHHLRGGRVARGAASLWARATMVGRTCWSVAPRLAAWAWTNV